MVSSTYCHPGETPAAHIETSADVTLDSISDDTTAVCDRTRALPPCSRATRYRIERRLLQARIAALEQALEAKSRERTAIIDQYEAILRERGRDVDHDGTDPGLVDRLRSLL